MPDSILDRTPADVSQQNRTRTPPPQNLHGSAGSGPIPPAQSVDKAAPTSLPPGYLADALEDAERLLEYAAEVGIDVDPKVRDVVLNARIASAAGLSEQTAADLLSALTQLVAHTRPVTAESLKACAHPERVHSVFRFYQKVAIGLAVIIVPWSLATAISTEMSEAIRKDLDTANALAVKLSDELGPPPSSEISSKAKGRADALPRGVSEKDVIRDLQEFAATIRSIYARARQLNFFTAFTVADPFARDKGDWAERKKTFELPEGLPNLPLAATEKIGVYQHVRYFAQSIQQSVATSFGAVATCILPMLYAVLGACAFLLRSFEEQIRTRTFTAADKHAARFLIAAIGGLVVGLFSNVNLTQGATLPPLAIAFLVGYAIDVFFSFLEGFLQTFKGARGNPGAPSAVASTKS